MPDTYVTTTNPWHLAKRAETFEGFVAAVHALDHDDLARAAVNTYLNDFAGRRADCEREETDPHGHGKRLPYVGWYWRSPDFAAGHVRIADCGDFIGVCENNKWGHPQREMTPDEVATFIGFLWRADQAASAGGQMSQTECRDVLDECWDWFQTLTIEGEAWNR